jgi:uncharacterized glyoxalase superfamily protein PhnB
MIELLKNIFNAKELRKFEGPDGTILHAEILIDDSVIMIGGSSEQYPPNQTMLHVYVKDVDETYLQALKLGCESIQEPIIKPGDSDKRELVKDFGGNTWAISTQVA